jgi:periodic tryptophan protein 1
VCVCVIIGGPGTRKQSVRINLPIKNKINCVKRMLTTFTWIPKGAMQTTPLHSTDTADDVRNKLRKMHPDYIEEDGHLAADDDDVDSNDGGDASDMFNRFGGGDTIIDQVESDDEEEIDDTTFKSTDLPFVVSRADPQEPKMELYVYDEPEDNLYVHHDMTVTAFPLSCAWLSDGTMSLAALGTMMPFIEIWPLDVIDAVEPACLLGGCENTDDNYRRKLKKDRLKEDSHKDAVLSLKWNTHVQHILASGSADNSIKLWDLNNQTCVGTYREQEKIQSLDWHPQEANLLLSGSFDGQVILRDCRRPEEAAVRWTLDDVLEHVEFAFHSNLVLASTSNGTLQALEPRMNSTALWKLQAHDAETTFACSRQLPGLIATGGKDGYLALWDARNAAVEPTQIVSRKYKTGSVMSIAFHPNSPHLLGACGSRGEPLVYTMTQDLATIF